jgi:hypothetical protein
MPIMLSHIPRDKRFTFTLLVPHFKKKGSLYDVDF